MNANIEMLTEKELQLINGGNNAGAAFVTALSCAKFGVLKGASLGPWGSALGGVGGAIICGVVFYNMN